VRNVEDVRVEVSMTRDERSGLERVAAQQEKTVAELFRMAMNRLMRDLGHPLVRLQEKRRMGRPLKS
jgi:hypothetical protein